MISIKSAAHRQHNKQVTIAIPVVATPLPQPLSLDAIVPIPTTLGKQLSVIVSPQSHMGGRPKGSNIEANKDKENRIQLTKDHMAIMLKEARDAPSPGKSLPQGAFKKIHDEVLIVGRFFPCVDHHATYRVHSCTF